MIKLSVSIFGQTTEYGIYTVCREPIVLPEIQYPKVLSKTVYSQRKNNFVVVFKIVAMFR